MRTSTMLPLAFGLIVGAVARIVHIPVDRRPTVRSSSRRHRRRRPRSGWLSTHDRRCRLRYPRTHRHRPGDHTRGPPRPRTARCRGAMLGRSCDAAGRGHRVAGNDTRGLRGQLSRSWCSRHDYDDRPRYRPGWVSRHGGRNRSSADPIERRRFRSSRGGQPNDHPHRSRIELCVHRPCLADGDHRAQPARPHRVRCRLHRDHGSDRGEPQHVGNRTGGPYQVFVDGVRQSQFLTNQSQRRFSCRVGTTSSNFRLPAHVRW